MAESTENFTISIQAHEGRIRMNITAAGNGLTIDMQADTAAALADRLFTLLPTIDYVDLEQVAAA